MKSILIVICARGGSKGVKNKNIRIISGKPLISYTIDTALKWDKADNVVVSTDSTDIKKIAQGCGAEVPFLRPMSLSGDDAAKGLAIHHAFLQSQIAFQKKYDIIIDLAVTSPIRTTEDLDNCLEIFLKSQSKTLFSVVRSKDNPYFNMGEINENGYFSLIKPHSGEWGEIYITRRQDAPIVYSMNGSIYFYDANYLMESDIKGPFTDKSSIYEMPETSKIDVDTENDLKYLNFILSKKEQ